MYLQISRLSFAYSKITVLDNISFSAEKGQIVGLLGPNGAGKTTLLKCIGCMLPFKAGEILLDGKDIASLSPRKRAQIVGYVPQSADKGLSARVVDVVMLGRSPYMRFSPTVEDRQIAFEALEQLDLASFAFRDFDELSGGERQRVLMARAVAQQPELLLLDEPTSSLDMKYQLETIRMVRSYAQERKVTVIVTIHDLNLAAALCDHMIMFKLGKCFADGDSEQILTKENVREVYEVDIDICECNGYKNVVFSKGNCSPITGMYN